MGEVLMIHEVEDWMLGLDLSEYDIITFDDGLYTQYNHYKHFLQFGKPLYFFISTDIVCPESDIQNGGVIKCSDAHRLYFSEYNRSHYMKWSQITEIYNTNNCYIGGHGHTHIRLKNELMTIAYHIVKSECTKMYDEFTGRDLKVTSFCFPYNEYIFGYKHTLDKLGFADYFGKERIPIENIK